tara:strand:+ start:400 stop:777 length:378 start_codon:yes stop_codon:yes gene_type:complete
MTDRVSVLEKIQNEARNLFKKKNQDYGDAFANYGAIGVLVRIGDKISRLQSITSRQITMVNTESLRDTLIDLHNYSAMAIMLLDENKCNNNNNNNLFNKTFFVKKTVSSPELQLYNQKLAVDDFE